MGHPVQHASRSIIVSQDAPIEAIEQCRMMAVYERPVVRQRRLHGARLMGVGRLFRTLPVDGFRVRQQSGERELIGI